MDNGIHHEDERTTWMSLRAMAWNRSSQAQKNGSYRIPPVKSSRTVDEVQNHSSLW